MTKEQRAALKAKVEQDRAAKQTGVHTVAGLPPREAEKAALEGKKPKDAGPKAMVVFACGCQKPVAAFKSGLCGECREAGRKAKAERKREKIAANLPAEPGEPHGRLPMGSVKTLVWDGTQWNGVLTVPDVGEFRCSASGEKGCFRLLDQLYRTALAAKG